MSNDSYHKKRWICAWLNIIFIQILSFSVLPVIFYWFWINLSGWIEVGIWSFGYGIYGIVQEKYNLSGRIQQYFENINFTVIFWIFTIGILFFFIRTLLQNDNQESRD